MEYRSIFAAMAAVYSRRGFWQNRSTGTRQHDHQQSTDKCLKERKSALATLMLTCYYEQTQMHE